MRNLLVDILSYLAPVRMSRSAPLLIRLSLTGRGRRIVLDTAGEGPHSKFHLHPLLSIAILIKKP
jgi:hypothetical protein